MTISQTTWSIMSFTKYICDFPIVTESFRLCLCSLVFTDSNNRGFTPPSSSAFNPPNSSTPSSASQPPPEVPSSLYDTSAPHQDSTYTISL